MGPGRKVPTNAPPTRPPPVASRRRARDADFRRHAERRRRRGRRVHRCACYVAADRHAPADPWRHAKQRGADSRLGRAVILGSTRNGQRARTAVSAASPPERRAVPRAARFAASAGTTAAGDRHPDPDDACRSAQRVARAVGRRRRRPRRRTAGRALDQRGVESGGREPSTRRSSRTPNSSCSAAIVTRPRAFGALRPAPGARRVDRVGDVPPVTSGSAPPAGGYGASTSTSMAANPADHRANRSRS